MPQPQRTVGIRDRSRGCPAPPETRGSSCRPASNTATSASRPGASAPLRASIPARRAGFAARRRLISAKACSGCSRSRAKTRRGSAPIPGNPMGAERKSSRPRSLSAVEKAQWSVAYVSKAPARGHLAQAADSGRVAQRRRAEPAVAVGPPQPGIVEKQIMRRGLAGQARLDAGLADRRRGLRRRDVHDMKPSAGRGRDLGHALDGPQLGLGRPQPGVVGRAEAFPRRRTRPGFRQDVFILGMDEDAASRTPFSGPAPANAPRSRPSAHTMRRGRSLGMSCRT